MEIPQGQQGVFLPYLQESGKGKRKWPQKTRLPPDISSSSQAKQVPLRPKVAQTLTSLKATEAPGCFSAQLRACSKVALTCLDPLAEAQLPVGALQSAAQRCDLGQQFSGGRNLKQPSGEQLAIGVLQGLAVRKGAVHPGRVLGHRLFRTRSLPCPWRVGERARGAGKGMWVTQELGSGDGEDRSEAKQRKAQRKVRGKDAR